MYSVTSGDYRAQSKRGHTDDTGQRERERRIELSLT